MEAPGGKPAVRLPVVGVTPTTEAGAAAPGPDAPAGRPDTPWWRLLATLGTAGAIAGVLIVVVYDLTLPRIQENQARVLQRAIQEVLEAPARYDTLFVYEGALVTQKPGGVDAGDLEQLYLGYREAGEPIGFAIVAAEPGFQDIVRLIFGYDAGTHRLLGMKVLDSRETPGLGDKILTDSAFIGEFRGAEPPLIGIRAGAGAKGGPGEIDMITGATISSRTVVKAMNDAMARLQPLMDAFAENGARTGG